MATTTTPPQIDYVALLSRLMGAGTAVHGPYEDAVIAFIVLLIVAGQGATPEQHQQMWTNWITLTQPLFDLIKALQPKP